MVTGAFGSRGVSACTAVAMAMCVVVVVVASAAVSETHHEKRQPNMNTQQYYLSETPGGHDTQKLFPTRYADYPRPVESFDVYSPLISQLYSQVFWKGLPPVDLPKEIVEKYKGKGMAVVGFEMDQVRRVNGKDVSVPINAVYNRESFFPLT